MNFMKGVFLFLVVIITSNSSKVQALGLALTDTNSHDHDYQCATLDLEICESGDVASCPQKKFSYTELSWDDKEQLSSKIFNNVSHVLNVSAKKSCHLSLCDSEYRMGHCVQFPAGARVVSEKFKDILQPGILGVHCRCRNDTSETGIPYSSEVFDRNYFGVVYSTYDKYWEPGPNGTFRRVSWSDYSQDEITVALKQISQNFTYIATFGMGTASNTSEWNEGDKVGFVPYLSAKINRDLGYPALRVAVGIFRKDDINLVWKSKELYNAIDAAKIANQIFNGTVWGIIVTSDFVSDSTTASEALDMIREVKEINSRDKLNLKVGIRLKTCQEFIASKRPEDDSVIPAYAQDNPVVNDSQGQISFKPLTGFQYSLYQIANVSDFILCNNILPSSLVQFSVKQATKMMQSRFLALRDTLRRMNPKLKLVIETGIPSEGFGNGFENSLENFRDYWMSMAEFSKKEHILFHMLEAIDQPWKNVQDGSRNRLDDINGPNGTDAHYGWWRRYNNSEPPVYIEKIKEIKLSSGKSLKEKEEQGRDSDVTSKIVLFGFIGFVVTMVCVMVYMWRKLDRAKKNVISQAYVNQFHSGTDDGSCDENYAVALKIPYDRKYELAKGTFNIDKFAVMGSGQSGIVCRGTIQCYTDPVAFKCTTPRSTVVDIKAIMSEIKILSYLGTHENLVCILGAYTRKIQRGIIYMALEFCPLGSVESFLRKADFKSLEVSKPDYNTSTYENMQLQNDLSRYVTLREKNGDTCEDGVTNLGYVSSFSEPVAATPYVTTSDLSFANAMKTSDPNKDAVNITIFLQWSEQIASAMEYVSMKNVIHADLAARNVLLVTLNQVKVSDFGLSRKMYQEMGVTHDKDTPLPWRWLAPESLKHLAFTSQSDVWAFGVTLWEIFSMGEVPYHGTTYDMGFVNRLVDGMRLPMAEHATLKIHQKLEECWKLTPHHRPSFKELQLFFHDLVKEYNHSHEENL